MINNRMEQWMLQPKQGHNCYLILSYNKIATCKYLEPRHTQMQYDAVHSLIERQLKNKDIIYARIIRKARQKSCFMAQYMTNLGIIVTNTIFSMGGQDIESPF